MTTTTTSRRTMNDLKKDEKEACQDAKDLDESVQPLLSVPDSQAQSSTRLRRNQIPSSSPAHPIQPSHTPVPARTLVTKYTDWKGSRINVFHGDDSTLLYHAKIKMTKPHMVFTSDNGSSVGDVTFHALSYRIDTTVNGNHIVLTPQGWLKNEYTFTSVAQPDSNLTWKWRRASSEILCTDQSGIQIARLSYRSLLYTKDGRIEIFEEKAANGRALDEIVISGLSLAHFIIVMNVGSLGLAAIVLGTI
ncbi:MAG: hypothetical protein Q9167_000608 [Letrouitia subvulpina]